MTQLPVIILLAAGSSSRMRGGDKQLELIDGEPVLRRIAKFALSTGAGIYIALPHEDHPRVNAIADLAVTPIYVADAEQGMGKSISTATRAVIDLCPQGIMFCPTDMPDLCDVHFKKVMQSWINAPTQIVQAKGRDGRPGHPVIFPFRLRHHLIELTGDKGAKSILSTQSPQYVTFDDLGPNTDLDTPEQWTAWRASH
jgi:molybdenum cofactor cytidylyltransferase